LQPLNFGKDLTYPDTSTIYAPCKVVEEERKLLDVAESPYLNWNQLFELDYNLNMSEQELVVKWGAD
jgi:hypothetical protein